MVKKSGDEKLLDYRSLTNEVAAYYGEEAVPVDEAELLNLGAIHAEAAKHHPQGVDATFDLSFADDASPEAPSPDDTQSDQA